MKKNKAAIYPLDAWTVTEEEFTIENNYRNETTFALSNGYIGTRGTMEEAYEFDVDTGMEGNFINGFYESTDIRYGEANFGSPLKSQTLLNLPNLKETRVTVDGETFSLLKSSVRDYSRSLLMKEGLVRRSLIWTTKEGKQIQMDSLRLVSFDCISMQTPGGTLQAAVVFNEAKPGQPSDPPALTIRDLFLTGPAVWVAEGEIGDDLL